MVLANLSLFIVSIIVLVLSGYFLVRYLSKIAFYLRLSDFMVAFIIMAFSTSLPELFVGIESALSNNPGLIIGTVIGSNIADLTIIIGIPLILARTITTTRVAKKDALYMAFIVIIPVILMLIGNSISRIDGIILLGIFVYYIYKQMQRRSEFTKGTIERIARWDVIKDVFIFMASLIVLFFTAEFVVKYASLLSIDLALPPILIGLFLVGIGTSLPEISFNIQAVLKGHKEMALGDTIGSVVANSTLVLGIAAIIRPLEANFLFFMISSFFMIIITFLFATMVDKGRRLNWKEGVALIMFYLFFLLVEFYIKNLQSGARVF